MSAAPDTLSFVSTLALDEAIFALIRLKVEEEHTGRGFWDVYREHPQAIRPHLGELQALVDRLAVDPRIRLVGTEPDVLPTALGIMDSLAFLPRDALHLTTMNRCGVDAIVTTDGDFLAVDGLGLFTCNPRLLSQR